MSENNCNTCNEEIVNVIPPPCLTCECDPGYCNEGCADYPPSGCIVYNGPTYSCIGVNPTDTPRLKDVIARMVQAYCDFTSSGQLDKFVRVSSTDTTSGYLQSKLDHDSYITLTKSGSNEILTIGVNITTLDEHINVLIANAAIKETSISKTDSSTISISLSGTSNHTISAALKISTFGGNAITVRNDGIYVATPASETSLSKTDTNSIAFGLSGTANHTLTGNVRISTDSGNQLSITASGLFVPIPQAFVETVLSKTDSNSIAFSLSGTSNHTITANSKISANAGNQVSILSDGLFVPAPPTYTQTPLSTVNTSSIAFGVSGANNHTLTGNVVLKSGTNGLSNSGGLYVDPNQFIDNQEAVEQLGNFRLRWGGGGAKLYWNGSSLILLSDDPSNVFIGYDAFAGSSGNNNIGFGTACHVNGSGNFNTVIGTKAGWQHIGNNSIFIGYGSGYSTNGDNNTIIGVSGGSKTTTNHSTLIGASTSAGEILATSSSIANSHVVVEGGPTMGTFTSTKLNGLSAFITAAGLNISDIVSFHIVFTGTAPLSDNGLGRTNEFYEKGEVVDVDTIRLFMAHWADQGSGTFTVEAFATTTNVIVVGNTAHADKSNQVVLGDSNIVQLRSNSLKIKTNVTPTKGQVLEFNGTEYVPSIITPQVLTYGATTTWNLDLGRNAKVVLTGNTTLAITNPVAGMFGIIRIVQDATGGRTITLPAGSIVSNGGGGAVTLTAAGNGVDLLGFYYDGTNYHWKKEPNYT